MQADCFNSRTPGGVRRAAPSLTAIPRAFQFTHPGRGATQLVFVLHRLGRVSIHAPREGCDHRVGRSLTKATEFQFTHPGRGATAQRAGTRCWRVVSIHAPREGCDRVRRDGALKDQGFNSRTPGGVRHVTRGVQDLYQQFQFTHPGRGATRWAIYGHCHAKVSIHAPREGCDSVVQSCVLWGG